MSSINLSNIKIIILGKIVNLYFCVTIRTYWPRSDKTFAWWAKQTAAGSRSGLFCDKIFFSSKFFFIFQSCRADKLAFKKVNKCRLKSKCKLNLFLSFRLKLFKPLFHSFYRSLAFNLLSRALGPVAHRQWVLFLLQQFIQQYLPV